MRRSIAVLAVVAGVGGCGGDSESTPVAEPTPRASAETPRQAVLEWWRYVQANDPESARVFYLDPPPLPDLAGQFNFLAGHVDGEAKVLSSKEKDWIVRVRVRWSPPGEKARPVTLRLRQEGGAWKLVDARFLDVRVAELQAKR